MDKQADKLARTAFLCASKQAVLDAAQAEAAIICRSWTDQQRQEYLASVLQVFEEVCAMGDKCS